MIETGFEEIAGDSRATLLALARSSISDHLQNRFSLPDPEALAPPLSLYRGVFVTLSKAGALRGCIGTLEASDPLAVAVADCAVGAAVRDHRFPSVVTEELAEVQISISVLGQPEPLDARDRADLLQQLRPGVDGLVVESGSRRATFLPQVWEQLDQPETFLSQLLLKAGLPADYWSERLRCSRYQCVKFSE